MRRLAALRRDPLVRAVRLLDVSWRRVGLAVLAGAGALGSAVALAAVSAWLIARASQMPPAMQLSIAAVAVRTFGISRGLLRYLERLASHDVALRGMTNLRTEIYRRLAEGRTEAVVGVRRGDLLARVGADVDDVGDAVVRGLLPAAVAVVVGLGSVGLLAAFLPAAGAWLGLCLVVAGVLAPWLATRAAARLEREQARARGEVAALTLTLLDGAGELAVSGRTASVHAALAGAEADLARAADRAARPTALAIAAGPLSTGLAVLGALVLGIPATTAGALAPVELAVVVLTPLAVFEAVTLLPAAGVQLLRSRQAAARILELLDAARPGAGPGGAPGEAAPRVAARRARAQAAPAPALTSTGPVTPATTPGPVLEARGLACGWPGGPTLLTGLDLRLEPGRSAVLVGPSGTGKTTLLLTLAGLLPPHGGEVLLDGRPLADVAPDARAAAVVMTGEDAHLFDTTVLENLRVARGDVDEAAARDALGQVGLGPWLDRLPTGLDTVLGADGAQVSGGERRRLLVARALLARAPLLLLDEPTEHLDAQGGALMHDLLAGDLPLARDRGILAVTHRFEGIEAADDVIVLAPDGTVRPPAEHGDDGDGRTGDGVARKDPFDDDAAGDDPWIPADHAPAGRRRS
ncbi:thiol reductant ABC exporter subunit CydC [Georgenia faecalis]|uniref:thiol reductant ABC exporter subunit CydC n=1 Tax=Georgenia faecalis TaxID=2483799 RepID=UPI000FDC32DF|nr:thiol reductant ABC exporter subunit CydC [Georgenia faecalis]